MRTRADHKIELLSSVPLFSACTRKELRHIASLADRVDVEAGHVLTREGELGHEFFAIAEGTAKVSSKGRKLATLGPGDFFGEMSLLDQHPRTATVTAETPMSLYVVGAADFNRLLDDVPFVARKMLKGLAGRLRGATKSLTH